MKTAVKAGKLANGWERGKGRVVHLIDTKKDLYMQKALCGEQPAIQWTEREDAQPTCSKCLKHFNEGKHLQQPADLENGPRCPNCGRLNCVCSEREDLNGKD